MDNLHGAFSNMRILQSMRFLVLSFLFGAIISYLPILNSNETAMALTSDKIVYLTTGGIATVNPDGTGFSSTGVYGEWPKISPDGSKIIFDRTAFSPDGRQYSDIYVMNVDGTNVTNLATVFCLNLAEQSMSGNPTTCDVPQWSPNGQQIAFHTDGNINKGISGGIYVMNYDGSNLHLAIPDAQYYYSWSPDGQKFVYNYSDRSIRTANIDGSNVTTLVDNSDNTYPFFSIWSPDGSRIAWASCASATNCNNKTIYTIHPDGTNRLTIATSDSRGIVYPFWSPDSSKIAWTNYNRDAITEVDSTGGTPTDLLTNLTPGGSFQTPSWWGMTSSKMINVSSISAPSTITTGGTFTASATFTSSFTNDTFAATWDWGDGTTTGNVSASSGNGSVTGSHAYSQPGVYTINLNIISSSGATGSAVFDYVTVVAPSLTAAFNGFVQYDSQSNWYVADTSSVGRAIVGVSAKYINGNLNAQAKFTFKSASVDFVSTACQWLSITGSTGQLSCTGSINGVGNYNMVITGTDNGQTDLIRVKIVDNSTNAVVYDTQMGAADNAAPTTIATGGNITVAQ